MEYVWWMPGPFIVGVHTRAICERIDRAIDDFLAGKSTFLQIDVPFRHGKSDICSRALPAYFLGRCAEVQPDVIMAGYGADLVEGLSRKTKAIIRSKAYQNVFPSIRIDGSRSSNAKWAIEGFTGETTVAGLGGAITGNGGHLIVIDDYCKKREEAESETYRNKTWDSFKDDVMTRRAPVSFVVVVATRWHWDDLSGRIQDETEDNPEFPRFERLSFPAGDEDRRYQSDTNPTGTLFPERFSLEWYRQQRATLGSYSAAALLDCDPVLRGGNMFQVDNVVIHDDIAEFPDVPHVRFWDLASTEKERAKDDPDYTVGALCALTEQDGLEHFWVKDMVYLQEEAPKRDRAIIAASERDGAAVRIGVESVAGYKDTATTMKHILAGRRSVDKVPVSGDKVVRSAPLEPIMEAKHFHILRAPWNQFFFNNFRPFPSGKHDDGVDSCSGAYHMLKGPSGRVKSGAFEGLGMF